MTFHSPINDKRKRRPDGSVIEDGEYIAFDVTLRDAAQAGTATQFLTDAEIDRAVCAEVDREHALHDHKFAFLGNIAPKFDRAQAEFLARNRILADARRPRRRSKIFAEHHAHDTAFDGANLRDAARRYRNAV